MHQPSGKFSSGDSGLAVKALLVGLITLAGTVPAAALGGKVTLVRKVRPGRRVVYQAKTQTTATVRANPAGLETFLPPLPTRLTTRQQNTVTIQAVHSDGSADVATRFDDFAFRSDLADRLPADARASAQQTEQELAQRIKGQTLVAHYDREGRLLGFEGGDQILASLEPTLREPLRLILKLFLDQMGGQALYPDHRVKRGEEWKRSLSSLPARQAGSVSNPVLLAAEGESTLRYVGKTKYQGAKAAIVDYRFTTTLKPEIESLRQIVPLGPIEAMGMSLDLGVAGRGQGRVLVALDDGRVLENRSSIHQTLTARLKKSSKTSSDSPEALTFEVEADTTLELDSPKEIQSPK